MVTHIGVDTGGTFSDFIRIADGALVIHKVLSTPHNPAQAVLAGAGARVPRPRRGGGGARLDRGDQRAAGAQGRPHGALVATQGFEDVLEIGRQTRPHLYDPFVEKLPPLVPQRMRFGVCRTFGLRR